MPLLTVTNLTDSDVVVQGGNLSLKVLANDAVTNKAIDDDDFQAVEAQLKAMATASKITWSRADDTTVTGDNAPDHGVGIAQLATVIMGASQALSGAGAVNITSRTTKFTSTGSAQALTLADGATVGQRKSIVHVVDGGSGVLTPAHLAIGTTITFTAVRDSAELEWNGTAWDIVHLIGATTA